MKILKTTALCAALALCAPAAHAHMVTFGWVDNLNGTVSLWAEHWHGLQTFPCSEGIKCSDNGGLTISGLGVTPYTVQWAATQNGTDRDDMLADGTLLGYQNTGNAGGGTYDNWLVTAPLVLGNGTWDFFTGTNCCIDTMDVPVSVTLTGIISVDPGTGPGGVGAVPLPAAGWMLMAALGGLTALRRRRI